MWISQKTRLHRTCKLHYKKKITRGDISLNPCTLNFSLLKFSLIKTLSLEKPPEPLKCLASTVQEPYSSLSASTSLSFMDSVRLRTTRLQQKIGSPAFYFIDQSYLKGLNLIREGLGDLNKAK